MNNLQKTQELKEKLMKWAKDYGDDSIDNEKYSEQLEEIKKQAQELLKDVEKGCERYIKRKVYCNKIHLCPTCEKAKKICEEVLK